MNELGKHLAAWVSLRHSSTGSSEDSFSPPSITFSTMADKLLRKHKSCTCQEQPHPAVCAGGWLIEKQFGIGNEKIKPHRQGWKNWPRANNMPKGKEGKQPGEITGNLINKDKYLMEAGTEGSNTLFLVKIEILEVSHKHEKDILFCGWLDAGTRCPKSCSKKKKQLHSILGSLAYLSQKVGQDNMQKCLLASISLWLSFLHPVDRSRDQPIILTLFPRFNNFSLTFYSLQSLPQLRIYLQLPLIHGASLSSHLVREGRNS